MYLIIDGFDQKIKRFLKNLLEILYKATGETPDALASWERQFNDFTDLKFRFLCQTVRYLGYAVRFSTYSVGGFCKCVRVNILHLESIHSMHESTTHTPQTEYNRLY